MVVISGSLIAMGLAQYYFIVCCASVIASVMGRDVSSCTCNGYHFWFCQYLISVWYLIWNMDVVISCSCVNLIFTSTGG